MTKKESKGRKTAEAVENQIGIKFDNNSNGENTMISNSTDDGGKTAETATNNSETINKEKSMKTKTGKKSGKTAKAVETTLAANHDGAAPAYPPTSRLYMAWSKVRQTHECKDNWLIKADVLEYDNVRMYWLMTERSSPAVDYGKAILGYRPGCPSQSYLDSLLTDDEVDRLRYLLMANGVDNLTVLPVTLPIRNDIEYENIIAPGFCMAFDLDAQEPLEDGVTQVSLTHSHDRAVGLDKIVGCYSLHSFDVVRTSPHPTGERYDDLLRCIAEANECLEYIGRGMRLVHVRNYFPYFVETVPASNYYTLSSTEQRQGVDSYNRIQPTRDIDACLELTKFQLRQQAVAKMNGEIEAANGDFRIVLQLDTPEHRGLRISLTDYNGLSEKERRYGIKDSTLFKWHNPNVSADSFPIASFYRCAYGMNPEASQDIAVHGGISHERAHSAGASLGAIILNTPHHRCIAELERRMNMAISDVATYDMPNVVPFAEDTATPSNTADQAGADCGAVDNASDASSSLAKATLTMLEPPRLFRAWSLVNHVKCDNTQHDNVVMNWYMPERRRPIVDYHQVPVQANYCGGSINTYPNCLLTADEATALKDCLQALGVTDFHCEEVTLPVPDNMRIEDALAGSHKPEAVCRCQQLGLHNGPVAVRDVVGLFIKPM